VRGHARHLVQPGSQERGPWQPPLGCKLRQGLSDPSAAGKAIPSVGPESERKVEVVSQRTSLEEGARWGALQLV
jgi:hypothetical protein